MAKSEVYKVIFINEGQVYEIYAKQIYQSDLYGFLEIEQIIFGEKSQLVVDPSEERLKAEFEGVNRSYIPVHSIIRIDEVDKQGTAKISDVKGDTVTPFPGLPVSDGKPKTNN